MPLTSDTSLTPSPNKRRRLGCFLLKLLVFVVLLYTPSAYILCSCGELVSIDSIVENHLNQEEEVLYKTRYHNHIPRFKHKMTTQLKPDVIVLGSSRSMSFRREFFKPEVSFYNAGKATDYLQAVRLFLLELPHDYKPKILILTMDQRWFQKYYYDVDMNFYFWDRMKPIQPLEIFIRSTPILYQELLSSGNVLHWRDLLFPQKQIRAGIDANNIGGFRRDGSFNYWYTNSTRGAINKSGHADAGFKWTLAQIHAGEIIDCTKPVYQESLKEMNNLLIYCKANHIEIVAFLAPYAPDIWKVIERKTNAKNNFTNELRRSLSALFAKYTFEFYDLSDSSLIGAKNDEFIDGWHGSEKTYLRTLIKMAEEGKVIKNLIDIEDSKRKLQNSKDSHFEIVHLDR